MNLDKFKNYIKENPIDNGSINKHKRLKQKELSEIKKIKERLNNNKDYQIKSDKKINKELQKWKKYTKQ